MSSTQKGAKTITERILTNARSLPASISAKLRYHAFRLVHNALPTAKLLQQSSLCPACLAHADSARHFFGDCVTFRTAARMTARAWRNTMPETTILTSARWDDYRFREEHTPMKMKIILAFSLAAWLARKTSSRLSFANCTQHLFKSLIQSMEPRQRKVRDRAREAEVFLREYRSLHPEASRAFTDGSSLDSGSGGSGFVVILGDGQKRYQSTYLGLASNNAAEISGLKTLFETTFQILSANPLMPRQPLFTFTDNKYAIQSVDGELRNKTNRSIIQGAKHALRLLRTLIPVTLGWVPGHAGIMLNECSDALAKRGAHGTTSSRPPAPPGARPLPAKPTLPFVPANVGPDPQDQKNLQPQSKYSLRPRKRVAYKRSGSQKQDISGVDFSMMPKTPARKKQKTAASSKRPTTTRPPTSPTQKPYGQVGLGRFGFTTTSSSGSSSSSAYKRLKQ